MVYIILLKEALQLYLQNIKDTAEKIQKLEYIENSVEVNDDDETFSLIQRGYSSTELQVPINSVKNKILVYKI